MQTRRLGNSDLDITLIGFGAWAIGGGDWMFGWGPQDDADSIAAIHARRRSRHQLDRHGGGVWPWPFRGSRRPRAWRAAGVAGVRTSSRSAAWSGTSKRELSHSLRPDSIRREVEGSLTRLGVDAIDLYQIHWPRWGSSPAGHDPGTVAEAWQTLADLKRRRQGPLHRRRRTSRWPTWKPPTASRPSPACSRPTRRCAATSRPTCCPGASRTTLASSSTRRCSRAC